MCPPPGWKACVSAIRWLTPSAGIVSTRRAFFSSLRHAAKWPRKNQRVSADRVVLVSSKITRRICFAFDGIGLDRGGARLSCADPNNVLQFGHKDLSVTDLTRPRSLDDG